MEDKQTKEFTVIQACGLLGISRPTCMRWLRSGKLPARIVGGRWRIPWSEIANLISYRVTREKAVLDFNGPLREAEVEEITTNVAHALRQLGAPVRKDGLRKVVLGEQPVDPMLWRFMNQVMRTASLSEEDKAQNLQEINEAWDKYLAGNGPHPWTGEESPVSGSQIKGPLTE